MVRTIFTRELETPGEQVTPYQAGRRGNVDFDLVQEMIQGYLQHNRMFLSRHITLMNVELASRVKGQDDIDGQAFIDSIIINLEKEVEPGREEYVDYLLSHLAQEFYTKGQNDITIDIHRFSEAHDIGFGLSGFPENHLSIEYILSENSMLGFRVGRDTKHCDMKISGKISTVGHGADGCNFYIDSIPEFIASAAHGSNFYISGVEKVSPLRRSYSYSYQGHTYGFKLNLKGPNGKKRVLLGKNFFYNNNRLFVPESSRKIPLFKIIHGLGSLKLIPADDGWLEVQR